LIKQSLRGLIVRENGGRKLDHATLEVLRMRAVEQVEAGEHPEVVAAALGMARGHGVRVAGQVPGGRPAGVEGQAGAGQAAEAERCPAAPLVHVDRGG